MFTGLISEIGLISSINRQNNSLFYQVECPKTAEVLSRGASVSVNGVCQTVRVVSPKGFETEAVSSTITKTTMDRLRRGDRVNLEPALRAGDPLDGHILQGHVQTTGKLLSVRRDGIARVLTIEAETGAAAGIVAEGSVGLDGISLTVSECRPGSFTVHIIPETWESTIIKFKRPGMLINLEGDILIRGRESVPAFNEDILREWGY